MDYINSDKLDNDATTVLPDRQISIIEDIRGSKVGTDAEVRRGLRIQYETEAQIIRKRLGGLKTIAESLRMNQRQIARILMVDPSAVHRWFKNEDKVPPYIWRLLDYHAALNIGPESDQIRYLKEQIRRIELTLYNLQTNTPLSTPPKKNLVLRSLYWVWSKFARLAG